MIGLPLKVLEGALIIWITRVYEKCRRDNRTKHKRKFSTRDKASDMQSGGT